MDCESSDVYVSSTLGLAYTQREASLHTRPPHVKERNLIQTGIQYEALVAGLNHKLGVVRTAIGGRR